MRRAYYRLRFIGIVAFWCTWPLLYVWLRFGSRVRVAVYSGGQLLLVRGFYGSGDWQLPGGGVHAGESPVQAAQRELQEETNLTVPLDALQLLAGNITVHERGLRYRCSVFAVQLDVTGALHPQASGLEILQLQWLPASVACEQLRSKKIRRLSEAEHSKLSGNLL